MIKAIFFDLDDTLYDYTDQVLNSSLLMIKDALLNNGINVDGLYERLSEIFKRRENREKKIEEICIKSGKSKKESKRIYEQILKIYYSPDVPISIKVFDDVIDTLKKLKEKYRLFLVNDGDLKRQENKIKYLGIKAYFEKIVIHERGSFKGMFFEGLMKKNGFKPDEVLVVGDKISEEIYEGNKLGAVTIRMLHGRYKNDVPENEDEIADYEVRNISDILDIVEKV